MADAKQIADSLSTALWYGAVLGGAGAAFVLGLRARGLDFFRRLGRGPTVPPSLTAPESHTPDATVLERLARAVAEVREDQRRRWRMEDEDRKARQAIADANAAHVRGCIEDLRVTHRDAQTDTTRRLADVNGRLDRLDRRLDTVRVELEGHIAEHETTTRDEERA